MDISYAIFHLVFVDKAIGFRLGSYKEGKVHVASPSDCDIAATDMIKAAQVIQSNETTNLLIVPLTYKPWRREDINET